MANTTNHPKSFTDKQFKPGQSGNPKGRPKSVLYISEAYKKILSTKLPPGKNLAEGFKEVLRQLVEDGATVAEFVALMQIQQAFRGKTPAAAEIADRVEGKPKQVTELVGPGEGPLQALNIDPNKMSSGDIRQLIEILTRAGTGGTGDNGSSGAGDSA